MRDGVARWQPALAFRSLAILVMPKSTIDEPIAMNRCDNACS